MTKISNPVLLISASTRDAIDNLYEPMKEHIAKDKVETVCYYNVMTNTLLLIYTYTFDYMFTVEPEVNGSMGHKYYDIYIHRGGYVFTPVHLFVFVFHWS